VRQEEAMRVDDPQITPERMRQFEAQGHWGPTTSNEELERAAESWPDKWAIVDPRIRITYADYYRRAQRLAAHFAGLGLGPDDVIAVQLPNWSEFAVAVNAAMLAGIPFCQFHSDFRSREVEFILGFTEASAIILPQRFRRFDYMKMIEELRPRLPKLKHIMVVGDDVPSSYFDLRRFLDQESGEPVADEPFS
jgi:non-ribosomal peptide synthetase component E (peptide arylation enzyme)